MIIKIVNKFKFLLWLALPVLVSCTGNPTISKTIARADSLLEKYPENAQTALSMLDSLKDRKPKMPQSQLMHYELVYAKAMNKGFVNFTTDSVMKQVAKYYDKHGTSNQQMEANYLLGCTYRDLNNSPAALDCYHKATEYADTTSHDLNYDLLAIIYGQLGYLLYCQDMPKFAVEAYEKTKRYATICKDTALYLQALSYQAIAYSKLGNKQTFIKTKKYLFHQYSKIGMKQAASLELCSTIHEYVRTSQLAKAKQLMDLYEKKSGLMDNKGNVAKGKEVYYSTKGTYYLKSQQVDSAIIMFRKLLQETSLIDEKEKAYRGLTQAYQKKCQLDSVAKYAILVQKATDSAFHEKATNTLIKMQSLYKYDQAERKVKTLEAEKQSSTYKNNLIVTMLFWGIVLICVFSWHKITKHKLKAKLEKEKLQVQLLRYIQDNQKLAEAKQKLHELYDQEKLSQEEVIKKYKQNISELEKRILIFETPSSVDEGLRVNKLILKSDVRQKIDKKATKGEYLTEEDLTDIKTLLDEHTPHFLTLIENSKLLSEKQIEICLLVRLFFTSTDIQHLLLISSGYASNAKKTISKKIFGDFMSPKEFDAKIRQML